MPGRLPGRVPPHSPAPPQYFFAKCLTFQPLHGIQLTAVPIAVQPFRVFYGAVGATE